MTVLINSTGITVDGVALNTVAKAVETKTGRLRVAGARGGNLQVAGRHGTIWTPNKPFDENHIVLPMYVLGCDDDGLIPGGSSALKEFYKNKELLQRLFSKRHALLDVRSTQPDTTVRQCFAEVVSEVDFEMFDETDARILYELVIPSVFWQDLNSVNQSFAGLTANTTSSYTTFAGGTAPMEDLGILLTVTNGTLTNPRITDMTTGWYVQYNDFLMQGTTVAQLYLDNSTWKARVGANTMGANPAGGISGDGKITHVGDTQRLLTVTPDPVTGAVSLQLSGTWAGATTATIQLIGRRKFHS